MIIHIFLESQAVAIYSFPCFSGQHEVEVDEPLELFGEVNAFREAKEGNHRKINLTVFLWIFF